MKNTVSILLIEPEAMLQFILQHKSSYFTLLKSAPEFKDWLAKAPGYSLQEKLYNFCFNLQQTPYCATCNSAHVKLKDRSFFRGYQTFCSKICAGASSKRAKAYKQTCKERFGGGSARASPAIQEKYNKSWSKNPDRDTILKCAKEKRKKTCNQRYGVDNVFSVPEIQQKAHERAARSMHAYREFISPKGNLYKVRGYEDLAIALLEKKYQPNEFIADDFKTPRIFYTLNEKQHIYYPDIFIPITNKIIEVKSWYWLNKQLQKNKAIMAEAQLKGFDFEFWVFSGKHLTVINTLSDLEGQI